MSISRLAADVSTPTLMALARHRDYRTTRRYVRVDGAHLRAAVERLAGFGCFVDPAMADLAVLWTGRLPEARSWADLSPSTSRGISDLAPESRTEG